MKSNRTRIFLMLALAATSSLFSQIVSSPPVSRSSPSLKYITARIHEKLRPVGQEQHVWVVSPLKWSRFKKNGSITEMQFLLIGERDWNPIGIDINKIGQIDYELSAQPEACVLPIPPNPGGASTHRFSDGELVRQSGTQAVSVIEKGIRRWIPDPETFTARGYSWGAIKDISSEEIRSIPEGQPIPSVIKR